MNIENRYRAIDVPVRGGDLHVGIWDPDGPGDSVDVPAVVAVHGVTASHRAWLTVARGLPGFRIIAPDLRGRGRSRGLPGPYGMAQHADDIVAVLDDLGIDTALVVGHSMGGWVSVALRDRCPERVRSLVLVDGGLPLPTPEGMSDEDLTTARLGLAKQRLSMTFPDRESYHQLFRVHPAFVDEWNDAVADYVDYDLVGEPPQLRSATAYAAMADDSVELQSRSDWLLPALDRLPNPTQFLRAQRGMVGEEPGLYAPDWIEQWQQRLPAVAVRDVLGVNHYTILFNQIGVSAVVDAVKAAAQ